MWKTIEINKKKYFKQCAIIANTFQFILYDLNENEGFGETIAQNDLLQRCRQMNKRIQFEDDIVQQTLTNGEVVHATLTEPKSNAKSAMIKKVLKLKYTVRGYPFNIEWHIDTMTNDEYRNNVLLPLLHVVGTMSNQIVELRECLGKKDVEIKQYKVEGAILRRTTVATQPFDFKLFDEKHKDANMQVDSIIQVAEQLGQHCGGVNIQPNGSAKTERLSTQTTMNKKKESPRNRKRKAKEFVDTHLERKAAQRQNKQSIQYENTESQSQSQEECDNEPTTTSAVGKSINRTVDDNANSENTLAKSKIKLKPAEPTKPKTRGRKKLTLSYSSSSSDEDGNDKGNERQFAPLLPPDNQTDDNGVSSTMSDEERSRNLALIQMQLKLLDEQRLADLKKTQCAKKRNV